MPKVSKALKKRLNSTEKAFEPPAPISSHLLNKTTITKKIHHPPTSKALGKANRTVLHHSPLRGVFHLFKVVPSHNLQGHHNSPNPRQLVEVGLDLRQPPSLPRHLR